MSGSKSRPTLGSAPRAKRVEAASSDQATALVEQLVATYRDQVKRALGVELDDSTTSLAFVDHHLRQAAGEDRSPILGLLAAGAGAYYGELIRREMGATWVGDGKDPRRLRLLLAPAFIHLSPADQALEAIVGHALDPEDDRVPAGPGFDAGFHLRPPPADDPDGEEHDANWLPARLAELAPIPEDQFHSLTGRFETLQLMLGLLASKRASEGVEPREHGLRDYIDVLTRG